MDKPGIRQRAGLALRVFRQGIPGRGRKASPYAWPRIRKGTPQYHLVDFETYVGEGFNSNALIYDAVMYKIRAKWLAPLRAYTGTLENPEPVDMSHPLSQLVARPNPYMSLMEFEAMNLAYANISGNSYVWMDRPKAGGLPEAMYPLRPDRVYVVPDPSSERGLLGYWYVPEGKAMSDGVALLYQDVAHVKYPNPGDTLEGLGEGLSPVSPAAKSSDVDNQVTDFLNEFFQRGLMPNVVLSFDAMLDDIEVGQVRSKWSEIYGGTDGWLKPGVLGQGGKVERLGYSFEEMGFSTIDERNETRILGPFGVPAVLVGARVGLANATYSNVEGLDRVFWQNTFVPELKLFESEYQYYLRSDDGAWVAYDLTDVPALQRFALEKIAAFSTLYDSGYPRDMAASIVSLPAPPSPGGEISYLPLSLVPAGSTLAGAQSPLVTPISDDSSDESPEAEEDERDEGKFWQARALMAEQQLSQAQAVQAKQDIPDSPKVHRGWTPAQKHAIWMKVDRIATSWEERFEEATARVMRKQQRQLLALATKELHGALERKASINWENIQYDWDQYFEQFAGEEWREEFMPLITGVMADQGSEWALTLGQQFNVRDITAEAWFQTYMLEFSEPINDTTKTDTHNVISQAMAEGWSIPQMEKQLGLTFDRYLDPGFILDGRRLSEQEMQWFTDRSPRYRREAIARTETVRASAVSSTELFDDWGIEKREWLATKDHRVRATHAIADGQVQPMGVPFDIGGFPMMHPIDFSMGAPLEEGINCRCTVLPVVEVG